MECNPKIVIAREMQQLRGEILQLTKDKESYTDSPEVLRMLEGFILRKQNRLVLFRSDYNMAD